MLKLNPMSKGVRQYIFVTGGVLSGVGKGITAASIGAILKARGLKVTMQKCDPYLNVDAGTLNPTEHGECFVTHDGAETDLDLGHYERFLDIELGKDAITLSGRLLKELIEAERAGKFLGKTVQLIPHLTGAIQEAIEDSGKGSEVHIVEIGGTVGDYEGLSYLEAIRELAARVGRENCLFVHVVYVPYLLASKEFKTKPAQNAIRDLRGFGISPNIIAARTDYKPANGIVDKLSLFGGIPKEAVITLPNADTTYRVPLELEESGVGDLIMRHFGRKKTKAKMSEWQTVVARATSNKTHRVKIGVVAKYLDNEDTYFSVVEALKSAAWHEGIALDYEWVSAEVLEREGTESLGKYDGLLLPGGFGSRGIEGKIAAADYALTHDVPYLGLCLGLQVAVVAAARRGGIKDAISTEIDPKSKSDVVYIMEDQRGKEATGGTMRLGNYDCEIKKGTLAERVYGQRDVVERHRHRYEVNRQFEDAINQGGLIISGESPDKKLVEIVESPGRKYFIATQAHPEFKSRPTRPHPLFSGLIRAALSSQKTSTPVII
jgi:CTP synthase